MKNTVICIGRQYGSGGYEIAKKVSEKLDIPFLFLCGGECRILRRIGGEIGCCMYLTVYEYDEFATLVQPLLKNVKAIRDNI